MDKIKLIDKQYNCIVTDDDNTQYYVFSNHIHNPNLHHWKGWKCSAGLETLLIDYDSKIYDAVCKNTYLGDLSTGHFELPTTQCTCNIEKCSPCTTDLAISKKSNK